MDNRSLKTTFPEWGEYSYILVGDGGGNTIDTNAAWCCYIYGCHANRIEKVDGYVSNGTNNFAELMAYTSALYYIQTKYKPERPRILIISDSELTINCGKGKYQINANKCWWQAIRNFQDVDGGDYRLYWKHVKRNEHPFNVLADKRCTELRKIHDNRI